MAFRKYSILLFTCGALVTLIGAAFNYLVDPYWMYGAKTYVGLNKFKPYAGDRGRISKLFQVERIKPLGLVVGNSRPEMGLNPEHSCWPRKSRPVYNISLPGLHAYQQIRYAQHAMATADITTMLIGVDFLDFLNRPGLENDPYQWPPEGRESTAFLTDANGVSSSNFQFSKTKNYLQSAFSLEALAHSAISMARQVGDVSGITSKGFNAAEKKYMSIVKSEGTSVLFQQKNKQVIRQMVAGAWTINTGPQPWSVQFESIRRILQQSKMKGVATQLFINPYHAEYLTAIQLSGLWGLFEKWKYRLAKLAQSESTPLWDFSGYNAYSTENIDDISKKGVSLNWFWEPAHYRQELGDIMLSNMLRKHCPQTDTVTQFGVKLDLSNIEQHLTSLRLAKETYLTTHELVINRLTKFIRR